MHMCMLVGSFSGLFPLIDFMIASVKLCYSNKMQKTGANKEKWFT